jgi:hypothetical protein
MIKKKEKVPLYLGLRCVIVILIKIKIVENFDYFDILA